MTDSASASTVPPEPPFPADACAVLLVDRDGQITGANATAAALWPGVELTGTAFVSRFQFEVTSADPDILEAQWEALVGSTLNRAVTLTLAPAGPDVRLRLEANAGRADFIATLQATGGSAPAPAGNDQAAEAVRQLAEHGAAGFFDLNFAADEVYFSPAWKKLLGYTVDELTDSLETWHELIHPDDSAAAPDTLGRKAQAGAGPRSFSVEFRMRHRTERWVWVQCTGVQLLNPAGELERVVGFHLDVSERKEIEETSLANDARLQDLSSAGPLAAFELDFTQAQFWFSPAWARLLGFAPDELKPELASFARALPPEQAADGAAAWLLARAPGQSASVEPVQLTNHEGRPVPVLLGLQRTITRKRELLRVVGFAVPLPPEASVDPTALPRALAKEAFDALAEAVVVTDPRGKILFANQTAARLLHADAAGLRGQPLGDALRLVNRLSGRPADDPVEIALAADQPPGFVASDALAGHAPTDPVLPIVWTARAMFGADAKAQGVVIVFRNPEEMTLTPEELVKANRFESLGLLAGGIAHDFNNLLTTIVGGVSLAKDSRDYSALEEADKACTTAKGLTRQLLAFAKGGAGTRVVCSAKDILSDSLKIAAAGSTAAISLDVAEAIEPVQVDRGQILQVFQNLIVNALQAMPPPPHRPRLQIRAGNVTLTEGQVPNLAPGDYVEFEVRDNGTGIPAEFLEKIFDPFFTTKKHGTGLGLATVLSIVRKHGGQIGLDTQVGVGTAFTVYLPKADKPVELQARKAPSLRFGTGRVLFMDDDPKICALTANMLQGLDYKYDLAKDGEEAITLYKRYLNIGRPYDAVIMDLTVVGGMGGEECFIALKQLDPEVRAIVASGYDSDDIAKHYMDMGFCGYLTKPYRVNDLGKVLKAVLG
ncbi:ATP-binding protein [Opitutus sp. ER46]|uniref:PAS domain-containing hybrid sensor histidine kinase/response regulator n=1 Tax=Opitutus sp. ER46 TaxID=2161864 RepID=UPI000D317C25|nr:ATP-binding protein [Opitutus sp. ER46]PTX90830.1 hypothetical protein DB354_19450 [Opitutus sp. ER46]